MGYVQELRAFVGQRPLILVAAGVLILDAQRRLLLQRRTDDDLWGVPGGCLEIGETLEETARREVREETGLEVGAMTLFGVFSGSEGHHTYPNGDQAQIVSIVYQTSDVSGEMEIVPDESRELSFFSVEELSCLAFSGQNRAIIHSFLQLKTQ